MADPYGGAFLSLSPPFAHFINNTPPDADVVPQLKKFQEFLTRASTSKSVFMGPSPRSTARQVIVLEDLPNILHADTRDKFHDTLRLFVQRQTLKDGEYIPLVVIVSDLGARGELEDTPTRGRNEALEIRSTLPTDLLSAPCVTQIRWVAW